MVSLPCLQHCPLPAKPCNGWHRRWTVASRQRNARMSWLSAQVFRACTSCTNCVSRGLMFRCLRLAAMWAALGIGTVILVHVSISRAWPTLSRSQRSCSRSGSGPRSTRLSPSFLSTPNTLQIALISKTTLRSTHASPPPTSMRTLTSGSSLPSVVDGSEHSIWSWQPVYSQPLRNQTSSAESTIKVIPTEPVYGRRKVSTSRANGLPSLVQDLRPCKRFH